MKIFLLTRDLDVGGAQRQLVVLAGELQRRGHLVRVGVFYSGGALADELAAGGVEIVALGKKGRWDLIPFLVRLVREIRRQRPDVIYTFLGSANVMGSVAKLFVPRVPLVWSIRASNMDLGEYDWVHRAGYKVECKLARSADLIIANSAAGAAFAVSNGFPAAKITIVANGTDTRRFKADSDLRRRKRLEFKLSDDDVAIGVLARLDPMKGHRYFLLAAAELATDIKTARFICIGEGPELSRLQELVIELGIERVVLFPGSQDAPGALNALDVLCSCSVSEGFSNAVAEAMACGLPIVVTDTGDSATIVGDGGAVVPPKSAAALATAIKEQVRNLGAHDRVRQRQRIVENFSVETMTNRTVAALTSVVQR